MLRFTEATSKAGLGTCVVIETLPTVKTAITTHA
jgi:hypothetical protein